MTGSGHGDQADDPALSGRVVVWLGLGLTDSGDSSQGTQTVANEETHLFRDGVEVPAQLDETGVLPMYPVPAAASSYRFTDVLTDGFPGPHPGTTVTTTWTFTSARPAAGNVGAPYACADTLISGDTDPCAWVSIIYLHYHLGLAPDDTSPAGQPHAFSITAGGGAPGAPAALARLQVWVSPDAGAHWTAGVVTPGPDHSLRVFLVNPTRTAGPTGTVWLKARAVDRSGNTVEQVIADAYRLS